MSRKLCLGLLVGFLNILWIGLASGGTYPIHIQYQRTGSFPLCKRIGGTLGLNPIRDKRSNQQHVGRYVNPRRVVSYLECIPAPLGKAIEDALSQCLSRRGVKVTLGLKWDGKEESLKSIETDSALMVEVERFWTEGTDTIGKPKTNTSIYLTVRLGIKREGRVVTRQIFTSKALILYPFSPDRIEQMVNRSLADLFDSFLSSIM